MQGIACRLFGAGFNQVGNGFGLGQIQFVIKEGALRKLSRSRLSGTGLFDGVEQQPQYHGSAMSLKFQYILASKRVGAGKVERYALVQHLAFVVMKRKVLRLPGWRKLAQ